MMIKTMTTMLRRSIMLKLKMMVRMIIITMKRPRKEYMAAKTHETAGLGGWGSTENFDWLSICSAIVRMFDSNLRRSELKLEVECQSAGMLSTTSFFSLDIGVFGKLTPSIISFVFCDVSGKFSATINTSGSGVDWELLWREASQSKLGGLFIVSCILTNSGDIWTLSAD